jgi:hypothetical protein
MNRDARNAVDVGARLRQGDPGRDGQLSPVAVAELRRAIDAAAEEPAPSWPWRAITAGVALTALAVALAVGVPQQALTPQAEVTQRPATAPNLKDQQLQFETADGTRIVWVLSPTMPL